MTFFNRQGRAALFAAAAVGLGLLAAGCGKKDAPATDAAAGLADPRDGQKYKTAVIGGQTWMAANLNYQAESGSWCYGDDESNCEKYGRLYNWNTAMTACPNGWRLPSRDEWAELVTVASSETGGKKLKSTSGWYDIGNGTDRFGFSALPGGYRVSDGSFKDVGEYGFWWTATEAGGGGAYGRLMGYGYDGVLEYYYGKGIGFSLRCVKNLNAVR
ncbi:hypothetical protein R80B4_00369 [Fibrobacteres bacterium R8-0-B4]